MCACTFCPTCPAILPCGERLESWPCRYNCPPPPCCCRPCCPPPVPCTPCPPCKCCTNFRQCPAPAIPDLVPPQVPELPPCRPRRAPPCLPCPPPPTPNVCYPPALPCIQPEGPTWCPPPRCPDPTPCVLPALPCCNPQCPPPILPKQRPICPRAPPACYPCLKACRTCCPHCELDPVTRRRPLIVHDSVAACRPTGYPELCFNRRNPNVRYECTNYVAQGPQSGCCYNVPVCLS